MEVVSFDRSDESLRQCVQKLMSMESINWSMKKWSSEILEQLGSTDANMESGEQFINKIQDIILNEAEVLVSQTQTFDEEALDSMDFDLDDNDSVRDNNTKGNDVGSKNNGWNADLDKLELMNDIFGSQSDDSSIMKSSSITRKKKSKKSKADDDEVSDAYTDGSNGSIAKKTTKKVEKKAPKEKKEKKEKAERPKKEKKERSKKAKESSSVGENAAPPNEGEGENTVVNEELAIEEKLAKGPTETELKRRQAIEIDEDEMEERLNRLKGQALHEISRSAGLSIREQMDILMDCKKFLQGRMKDKQWDDYINDSISVQIRRCFGYDVPVKFEEDVKNHMLSFVEDDDNDWYEEALRVEKQQQDSGVGDSPNTSRENESEEDKDMICLSDSEEEEDDEDDVEVNMKQADVIPLAQQQSTVQEIKKALFPELLVTSKPTMTLFEKIQEDLQKKKAAMMKNHNVARSARSLLHVTLRQKVHEKFEENYCKQYRIPTKDLSDRATVMEKCRQLVEYLKLKRERDIHRQNKERRAANKSKNVSFDEEYEVESDIEEQLLTDEQRLMLMRSLRRGVHYEDESEVSDNGSHYDDDEEQGEEEENEEGEGDENSMHDNEAMEVDDNDENIKDELQSSMAVGDGDMEDDSNKVENNEPSNEDNIVTGNDVAPDEEQPQRRPKVTAIFGRRTANVIEDDNDAKPIEESSQKQTEVVENDDDILALDEAPSTLRDVEHTFEYDYAEKSTASVDEATEGDKAESDVPTKPNKSKMPRNLRYRLELEEEEKRYKAMKNADKGFADFEAEEEEEDEKQGGLGFFGFTTSKNREEDEAFKVTKDDLEHVVDELSDDEEEGDGLAYFKDQQKDDLKQTRKIIESIGKGGVQRKETNKNLLSFDDIVQDKNDLLRNSTEQGNAEAEENLDFDEEELLLRNLQQLNEAEKEKARRSEFDDFDDIDDDSEDDMEKENAEAGEDGEGGKLDSNYRERRRLQRLKRRQFEEHAKRRRALRKLGTITSLTATSSTISAEQNATGASTMSRTSSLANLARSTSTSELNSSSGNTSSVGITRIPSIINVASVAAPGSTISRTSSLANLARSTSSSGLNSSIGNTSSVGGITRNPSIINVASAVSQSVTPMEPTTQLSDATEAVHMKRRTSMMPQKFGNNRHITSHAASSSRFRGELSMEEKQGGYGMGMVKVQGRSFRKSVTIGVAGGEDSNSNLVNGNNNSNTNNSTSNNAGTSNNIGGFARRSSLSNRKTISVPSQQHFVFMAEDTQVSNGGNSGMGLKRTHSQASTPLYSSDNSNHGYGNPEDSLFSKISRTNSLKRISSIV